ncbi:flagellar basal body rod protein FlgB [Roseibium litorale]|uniref:Flagellar basal body rod protein FlgB n=1 Tax=Roseibium litorale TaxID=2803841 RepID=A0ABR9CHV0_9HYPH|nr:flagellar basal body rod protein FlgB [Roseibium litorale]MBD8890406.1 flagellar basal body rod protein FlgB [Roseibium litorale]
MALTDLPIFQALKSKMQWHQVRQGVLAENVANSDTPHYKAKDVKDFAFADHIGRKEFGLQTAVTKSGHITGAMTGGNKAKVEEQDMFEVTPSGNNVNLEEQMMLVTQNQMDFQAATSIYSRSLGLIKTALSKSA